MDFLPLSKGGRAAVAERYTMLVKSYIIHTPAYRPSQTRSPKSTHQILNPPYTLIFSPSTQLFIITRSVGD